MAQGRDIHGKVVMDATVEVSDAEAKLNSFFEQVFEINTSINLPPKAVFQKQLDTYLKGVRGAVKVDLVLDTGDLAKSVAQVKAAESAITKAQATESAKRITDNVKTANKVKLVQENLVADSIRLDEQSAAARKVIEAELQADRIRALDEYTNLQRSEAIKQSTIDKKAGNARKAVDKQVEAARVRGEVAQTTVTVRETEKRLTAAEVARLKEIGFYTKTELDKIIIAERTNARLEILSEQHLNRINAQEQAATLRREIIEAQLNARITAADRAFEQRRQFASEASQRKLQQQASKPILQKVLIDANAINSSLADFDRTVTRGLRTSLTAFTVWSAGVEAAVAGAALAAAVSFGKLEGAATRAGAVVASQTQADQYIKTGQVISNFSDLTSDAADKIQAKAQEIALATTGFSPTQVIEGTRALLQAGQSLPEALINIGNSAQFAQVNQQDLAESSDQLAAGLAAAGKGAEYSAKLLDQISFTAQTALGDASEYLEAFANRGASSFRTYGEGIEETLTLLTLLGQTGVKGKAAGTQASIVIRDIAKAAAKSPDAFKKYGIAVKSATTPGVAFNETLLTLSDAIERAQKGNRIAELRKELGFMDRSFGSILQVVPQVNKLGASGLDNFASGLKNSSGQVRKQVDEINKTLPAQFDKVGDAVNIALGKIGERFGPQLTSFFDVLSGPGGLIPQAGDALVGFGDRVGSVIERVTAFVQTPAFRRGVQTFVDAIGVTLEGVNASFQAFAQAFDDGDKARSTFEAIADSILGFSRAAATVLPVVAEIIGEILDFLIDNADAFETFAKITLAIYLMRKAFTLVIAPALTAFNALDKFLKTSQALAAAGTIGPIRNAILAIASSMGLVTKRTEAATKATKELAKAEALLDIVNTPGLGNLGGRGTRGAGRRGQDIGTDAVTNARRGSELGRSNRQLQGLDTAVDAALAGAQFEKLGGQTAAASGGMRAFAGAASKLTLATAALYAAIPLTTGAVGGFTKAMEEARLESRELDSAIGSLKGGFAKLDEGLGKAGNFIGESIGKQTAGAIQLISDFDKFFRTGTTRRQREEEAAEKRRAAAAERAAAAQERARQVIERAVNTTARFDAATGKFTKTTDRSSTAFTIFGTTVGGVAGTIRDTLSGVATSADAVLDTILRKTAEGRELLAQAARDSLVLQATIQAGARLDIESQGLIAGGALNPSKIPGIAKGLKIIERQRAAAAKKADAALKTSTAIPGAGVDAGAAVQPKQREFVDPDEAVKAAIDKLKPAKRAAELEKVIATTTKRAGDAFTLTRRNTLLLAEAIPGLEKNIDKSREAVEKLDQALNDLRNTQLQGTQAFSDQGFAIDQQVKQLQLNRLDALAVPGTTDESPQVKAIDDQITALQTQAERLQLQESLQLDPLRRKLEQTFEPVKEDTFANITAQFANLTAQQKTQTDQLAVQEAQRDRLNAALERSQAAYARIDEASQRSVDAFNKAQQAAASTAAAIGSVSSSATSGAAAVNSYSDAVEDVPTGAGVVDKSLKGINARVELLQAQFRGAGARIVNLMSAGITGAATATLIPALAGVMGQINLLVRSSEPVAIASGKALMDGFLTGIKQGFGTPQDVGTVAWYLNVFIPDWIRKNKGPVAYDATILVPAGNAVMEGFGKGLRSGFGEIQGFIKEVGPSLREIIGPDLFSGRVATVMADVAVGKTPDIEGVFGDLRAQIGVDNGSFAGISDPLLQFLHRTLSLADTQRMAASLVKTYQGGLNVSSTDRASGTLTSSGNVSAHTFGTAADIGTGGARPTAASLKLFEALQKELGKTVRQLIHNGVGLNAGGGSFADSQHFDHVHVEFMKGLGFDKYSGKIGKPAVIDIPGAPPIVDQAINAASAKYGTELALLAAVAKAESGFRTDVGSPAGARGLFQFIPSTARGFGINPLDPFQAAEGGARYLNNLLKMFSGRYNLALAGYNAGPNAPGLSEGKIPPYPETQNYVRTVLGFLDEFRKQFGGFRALGGQTLSSKSYVVGERGPEIFTPSRNGTIIPNDETQRIMGGGTSTYNDNRQINVTTAATDPEVVADYVDAKTKTKFVGVNSR